MPHYDVIASDPKGGHLAVQVKTIRGTTWQFDMRSFLHVDFDGTRQVLGRAKREPYPRLICVLVALRRDEPGSADRFFVLTWRKLRAIIVRGYRRYLRKHGGVRPRSPESYHTAVHVDSVAAFRRAMGIDSQTARQGATRQRLKGAACPVASFAAPLF